MHCFSCHTLAGIHTVLGLYYSFWLCLHPRASDIRVNPPFLSHVTQESLTKGTHFPKSGCSLPPSLGSLDSVSGYSGARGFFLPSQITIGTVCYQEVPFPWAVEVTSAQAAPSQGAEPARSADGACKSSQHRERPPSPILHKEWPQISKQGLRVVTRKRADVWDGSQLAKCHYPKRWATLSSLTPGFPPVPPLLDAGTVLSHPLGTDVLSWHS